MLSKQIEGAQKKVEEQNFLIRKRVLEYDDVMNQQREVIYEYRDRILEGEDMSEVAREQIADAIERIAREYTPGEYHEDWDLDGLFTQLDQIFDHSFEVEDIKEGIDRETLVAQLREDVVEAYDEREEELGDELMRELERFMLLQIIDERWREHLHDMDYLREGIHLRGFAQIDPLVAYKNEGFEMFAELMNSIWDEFARYVFHVEVETEDQQQAQAAGPNWGMGGNSTATRNLNTSGGRARRPRRDRRRCGRRRAGRRGRGRPDGGGGRGGTGGRRDAPARRHREDRPQRPLLVRLGQEVQEVPRRIALDGLRDQLKLLADSL